MPYYHTMIDDGIVTRWQTVLANCPAHAIRKAIETWQRFGNRPINGKAVYENRSGDANLCYHCKPECVFADRPNLLEATS